MGTGTVPYLAKYAQNRSLVFNSLFSLHTSICSSAIFSFSHFIITNLPIFISLVSLFTLLLTLFSIFFYQLLWAFLIIKFLSSVLSYYQVSSPIFCNIILFNSLSCFNYVILLLLSSYYWPFTFPLGSKALFYCVVLASLIVCQSLWSFIIYLYLVIVYNILISSFTFWHWSW